MLWGWFLHCSTSLRPQMCIFANRCSCNARIIVLPKLTFVLLCSPFSFPLLHWWRFAVVPLRSFMEDLATAVIAEEFNTLSFCLNRSVKCLTALKMKRNHPFTVTNRSWGHALSRVISMFPCSAKKRYFSCSPLSIALTNGANIREYKAYWHMSLSLINGCGTRENKIHSHSFFWSGACDHEFTKYYNRY